MLSPLAALTLTAAPALALQGGALSFSDLGGSVHALGSADGGLAAIDADGDRWQDLLIGDGGGVIRFYRNVPGTTTARTFVDATAGSGFGDPDASARDTSGIVVADVDGDGRDDVFVSGYSSGDFTSGLLYRNLGGGAFQNVSLASGARVTNYRIGSTSLVDHDHDGDIDLFAVCYSGSTRNYLLLDNDGGGQFTSITAPLPSHSFFRAYSHLWSDIDGDGWEDCVVLVDNSAARLLHNQDAGGGARQLVDVAAAWGFGSLGTFPMGVASGDFDGDGDFDLALSNANDGKYFRNDGGMLTPITPFTSVWGWGVSWIDGENDGDLDLYMAGSWPNQAPDKLFENLGGGAFVDSSSALGPPASVTSRYSIAIDIENDGHLDLVTVNPGGIAAIDVYANGSQTTNHWIGLALTGGGGVNPSALGARVRLRAGGAVQAREVRSGSSTTSSEDRRLVFGLGSASAVDWIEVLWPRDGEACERTELFLGPFAPDTYHVLAPRTGSSGASADFCFGDGGVQAGCTPCPCSNDAPSGTRGGCLHPGGASARLLRSGCARASADDLRLELRSAAPASFAVLTSGAQRAPANPANPCFGQDSGLQSTSLDGLRCVVSDVRRHGSPATDASGVVGLKTPGWGPPSGPAGGLIQAAGFVVGQTRHWQAIYRVNPGAGCGQGQNTTQATSTTVLP